MTLTVIIVLILIGLVAGVFSGLIGIGGAIIIIPALIYFLGMDQFSAQGTSLGIMLPPIGILAAWSYYKQGALNFQYAMIIAAAFIVGGYIGSRFALNVPESTLRRIFAIMLAIIAVKMFISK